MASSTVPPDELSANDRHARAVIRQSGLVDAQRYVAQLQDAPADPVAHYLSHGAALGLSPSAHFDAAWYLSTYPDVADAGVDPWLHYLEFGRAEGRHPRAFVDPMLTDAAKRISLLEHKLAHEQQRVDYLLGEIEGMAHYRRQFDEVRHTAAYQDAFTETDPLVTVCIATAGRPDLLIERCIASVRAQTHANLQILVVGDHCLDDTAQRLAAVGDPRIEFHNMPRRGPYPKPGKDRWMVAGTVPGNVARLKAKGTFITYIDDDDSYEPNRIEVLLATARRTRADFIWHKFWFLQPDGAWTLHGSDRFESGQVGASMVFHHAFFKIVPFDVYAYRVQEPGDWNFARRINFLRPKKFYLDEPLTRYHKSYSDVLFVAQDGEEFLD